MTVVLVALGGAAGSVLRYLASVAGTRLFGASFPAGTLFVNLVGCFLIGLCAELVLRRLGGSAEMRLLLMTGVLGGFTTFSAFSLDAILLWERGAVAASIAYVLVSVVLGIAAAVAGLMLGRSFS